MPQYADHTDIRRSRGKRKLSLDAPETSYHQLATSSLDTVTLPAKQKESMKKAALRYTVAGAANNSNAVFPLPPIGVGVRGDRGDGGCSINSEKVLNRHSKCTNGGVSKAELMNATRIMVLLNSVKRIQHRALVGEARAKQKLARFDDVTRGREAPQNHRQFQYQQQHYDEVSSISGGSWQDLITASTYQATAAPRELTTMRAPGSNRKSASLNGNAEDDDAWHRAYCSRTPFAALNKLMAGKGALPVDRNPQANGRFGALSKIDGAETLAMDEQRHRVPALGSSDGGADDAMVASFDWSAAMTAVNSDGLKTGQDRPSSVATVSMGDLSKVDASLACKTDRAHVLDTMRGIHHKLARRHEVSDQNRGLGLRDKETVSLPRHSAARGKLAIARIDAIIEVLVQETANIRPKVSLDGQGSRRRRNWNGVLGLRRHAASSGTGRRENLVGGTGRGGHGGDAVLSEGAIDAVVSFVDMDQSGEIDLKELKVAMSAAEQGRLADPELTSSMLQIEDELRRRRLSIAGVFELLDIDGNGTLSRRELSEGLSVLCGHDRVKVIQKRQERRRRKRKLEEEEEDKMNAQRIESSTDLEGLPMPPALQEDDYFATDMPSFFSRTSDPTFLTLSNNSPADSDYLLDDASFALGGGGRFRRAAPGVLSTFDSESTTRGAQHRTNGSLLGSNFAKKSAGTSDRSANLKVAERQLEQLKEGVLIQKAAEKIPPLPPAPATSNDRAPNIGQQDASLLNLTERRESNRQGRLVANYDGGVLSPRKQALPSSEECRGGEEGRDADVGSIPRRSKSFDRKNSSSRGESGLFPKHDPNLNAYALEEIDPNPAAADISASTNEEPMAMRHDSHEAKIQAANTKQARELMEGHDDSGRLRSALKAPNNTSNDVDTISATHTAVHTEIAVNSTITPIPSRPAALHVDGVGARAGPSRAVMVGGRASLVKAAAVGLGEDIVERQKKYDLTDRYLRGLLQTRFECERLPYLFAARSRSRLHGYTVKSAYEMARKQAARMPPLV